MYNLDGPVPGARNKGIFVYRVPANRKGLSLVFMEIHDGEIIQSEIKQLQGSISASCDELILVDLGPGEVI
jgi:hypothetical protein